MNSNDEINGERHRVMDRVTYFSVIKTCFLNKNDFPRFITMLSAPRHTGHEHLFNMNVDMRYLSIRMVFLFEATDLRSFMKMLLGGTRHLSKLILKALEKDILGGKN